MAKSLTKTLDEIFIVKSGDYHANYELETGNVPLVSCGDTNNGVVGFFDIPQENIYRHAITVAYNGQPLTTKFHPYEFGTKDDVAVLIPRTPMKETTLLYIAVLLNDLQWRFSYGRKCYREKMEKITISLPMLNEHKIDEERIAKLCPMDYSVFIPNWLQTVLKRDVQ